MGKFMLTLVFCAFAFVYSTGVNATPFIDDPLGWFGVDLTFNSATGDFDLGSFAPDPGVDYVVEDYDTGGSGVGLPFGGDPSPNSDMGEWFDTEAIYFHNDGTHARIAVVTSFPNEMMYWTYTSAKGWYISSGGYAIAPGSIAIGGYSPDYDGTKGRLTSFDYGITAGGELYQTTSADWEHQTVRSVSYRRDLLTQVKAGSGTQISGLSGFSYQMLSDYYGDGTPGKEIWDSNIGGPRDWETWVIAAQMDSQLLSNLSLGDTFGIQWATGCGNDFLTLRTETVPEPGALALLCSSLMGFVGYGRIASRRIKKNWKELSL
jgi:hypothetical protein